MKAVNRPGNEPTPRLRVAQGATGNVGMRSLRAVIDHPGLELDALSLPVEETFGFTNFGEDRSVDVSVVLTSDGVAREQEPA